MDKEQVFKELHNMSAGWMSHEEIVEYLMNEFLMDWDEADDWAKMYLAQFKEIDGD